MRLQLLSTNRQRIGELVLSTNRRPLAQKQPQQQQQCVVVNYLPTLHPTSHSTSTMTTPNSTLSNNPDSFMITSSNADSGNTSMASVGAYSDFAVSTADDLKQWLIYATAFR